MVGSIITNIETPAVPFELGGNFGLSLGEENDVQKYQLYTDEQTALWVVRGLNRTHGRHEIDFPDVFRDRIEPTGGYRHVSYVAWLNAGPDIVRSLTSPRAVENAEDAAATLLGQMSGYGEDLLKNESIIPAGTHERLIDAIIREAKDRKKEPVLEPDAAFADMPTFASLHEDGLRPTIARTRAWLESHITPLSLEFWTDPHVFVHLTEYGGTPLREYSEPDQPQVYRDAVEQSRQRRFLNNVQQYRRGRAATSSVVELVTQ